MFTNATTTYIPEARPLSTARRNSGNSFSFRHVANIPANTITIPVEKPLAIYAPYVLPIKTGGYKEIESFEIPNIGKGKTFQLDNGHKVVIVSKPGPTTIKTSVNVGAFNESPRVKGASHLLEHVLANSFLVAQKGGESDANTSNSDTNFIAQYPVSNTSELDMLLKSQAETILNPNFSDKNIEQERKIILSEINMDSSKDIEEEKIASSLYSTLFNENIDLNIGGTAQSVNNISKNDLVNHYNNWYKGNNMTTAIVGDVDIDQTITLFNKYFNKSEKNAASTGENLLPSFNNPIQKTKRVDYTSPNTDAVNIKMGFVIPNNDKNGNKNSLEAKMLKEILARRFDNKLSTVHFDFDAYNVAGRNTPIVITMGRGCDKGVEEDVLNFLYRGTYSLIKEPISAKELEIAKIKLREAHSVRNEKSGYLTDILGGYLQSDGKVSNYVDIFKTINSVGVPDIQNFASKYMDLNKTAIVMTHPQQKQPSFKGYSKALDMQHINDYYLPNNMRLVVDHSPAISRTAVNLTLKSGNNINKKPGAEFLLGVMLEDALKNEHNRDFIDLNGIYMSATTDKGAILIDIDCESDKTLTGIQVLKNVILNPQFKKENFEDSKSKLKDVLKEYSNDPFKKASELINPASGENTYKEMYENIDSIAFEDITSLYSNMVTGAQGQAVISVPDSEHQKNKNNIIGQFSYGFPAFQPYKQNLVPEVKNASPISKMQVLTKEENDNQIKVGQSFKIVESGNIKDQLALHLLNKILGGSPKSLIFNDLRESQGLYNPSSNYNTDGRIGMFSIVAEKTADTNPATNDIQNILAGFKNSINSLTNNPVSQEELQIAKAQLKNEFFNNLEGSLSRKSLIAQSLQMPYYGLSYANEFLTTIDKIEPAHIQKAAQLFLDKPSIISITASKDVLNRNKAFISNLGDRIS